jgi:hypothetical protein
MVTYNRGKLLRLAKAGKLVTVSTYSFDDSYGASRSSKQMPVVVRTPENQGIYQDGICYVREDEFKNYGNATEHNGIITLHVHSNKNYDFKVIA